MFTESLVDVLKAKGPSGPFVWRGGRRRSGRVVSRPFHHPHPEAHHLGLAILSAREAGDGCRARRERSSRSATISKSAPHRL